jgi:mRNA-degrading endonuclease RelE of RelBE toxin-antitoxin system
MRAALLQISSRMSGPTGRGGKSLKSIHGAGDDFWRLRVGDYRVMFDVIRADAVILVLGIVHRRDLESWLRSR